jgi:hypothetical protein
VKAAKKMRRLTRTAIVDAVTRFYIESKDFNGYPVHQLNHEFEFTSEDLLTLLRALVSDREMDIVYDNLHPNPHIKAFSTVAAAAQLRFIETLGLQSNFCLYPSKETLATRDFDQHKTEVAQLVKTTNPEI